MSAISVEGLGKDFGDFEAVKSVDLEVPKGQFLTLLGPSGSGKTTVLRCLAGLEVPTRGEIRLTGETVAAPARGVSVPPERRGVGFVFQNYALWPHMTVRSNVQYPLKLQKKLDRAARRARAEELLELVGLEQFGGNRASDLSGGQQQRVALARALANDSAFMLFDEPLSNLDAQLRLRTRAAIRDIHDRLGTTTVYVTHDQDEAFSISDRVVVMNHGVVEQDDDPETIYERPASPFIARFVGFDNVIEHARLLRFEDADHAVIDLPGGLGTCVARRGACREGDTVTVAFRARDVLVGNAVRPGSGPTVNAEVRHVSFSSGTWSIGLAVGGHLLQCQVGSTNGRPDLATGENIVIQVAARRPIVLPDSSSSGV